MSVNTVLSLVRSESMRLFAAYNYLKREGREVGLSLFSQVISKRTRENDLKLHQGKFNLDIRKHFFNTRVLRH